MYSYHADSYIDNLTGYYKTDGVGAFTVDKWANIQVTTEILSVGDYILESDLNLYVWIPIYIYIY